MAYQLSTRQLIAEVMVELALPDESMLPIMLTWSKEAMRAIGGSKLFAVETEWLPIDDLQFLKPKDFVAPLSITLKTDAGACIKPHMDSDTESCSCCENCNISCEVTVGENATHFHLSSNGNRYTLAKMKYIGQPLGECGTPLVDGKAGRAVKQYIIWKTKATQRNKFKDSTPQSEVQYEYQLWTKLADQAYGNIMMPNTLELKKLGVTWLNAGFSPAMFVNRLY